ncbi:MAG: hypothetical protein J5677_04865 [Bacteroidales bacterium]|nr:hypothetical protein [Bacteroidales bacterium]
MTTIDNNNYELWLLRYAEGELTAAEREAVETRLASHPEAAEELALYGEAPRLERDETVRYSRLSPFTSHLSPLLRWSAAAAVVVALMVPALRMGTMDTLESPAAPLMAEAGEMDTTEAMEEILERMEKLPRKSLPAIIAAIPSIDSIPSIPSIDTITAIPIEIIETNSLIVFEESPAKATLVETGSLIAYDRSADWGDMLLVANDAYREGLSEYPMGRVVSRALPDSRQLAENFVEPLREKIDNIKSKIK